MPKIQLGQQPSSDEGITKCFGRSPLVGDIVGQFFVSMFHYLLPWSASLAFKSMKFFNTILFQTLCSQAVLCLVHKINCLQTGLDKRHELTLEII